MNWKQNLNEHYVHARTWSSCRSLFHKIPLPARYDKGHSCGLKCTLWSKENKFQNGMIRLVIISFYPLTWLLYNRRMNPVRRVTFFPFTMEFSLNGAELSLNSVNSGNSENLKNHWSMNWVQYKDLLCYLCLCGLVVSSLSLTQEILGSSPTLPFLYFINFFCHWIQRIQWKPLEKTSMRREPNVRVSHQFPCNSRSIILCVDSSCSFYHDIHISNKMFIALVVTLI